METKHRSIPVPVTTKRDSTWYCTFAETIKLTFRQCFLLADVLERLCSGFLVHVVS